MAWYIRVTNRAATSYKDLSSFSFIVKRIINNLLLTRLIKSSTAHCGVQKDCFFFQKEWYKFYQVIEVTSSSHCRCSCTSAHLRLQTFWVFKYINKTIIWVKFSATDVAKEVWTKPFVIHILLHLCPWKCIDEDLYERIITPLILLKFNAKSLQVENKKKYKLSLQLKCDNHVTFWPLEVYYNCSNCRICFLYLGEGLYN